MTRPIPDWAEPKYLANATQAHIVAFGVADPLCGAAAMPQEWLGTGTFDEIEHAQSLPLCQHCTARLTSQVGGAA